MQSIHITYSEAVTIDYNNKLGNYFKTQNRAPSITVLKTAHILIYI